MRNDISITHVVVNLRKTFEKFTAEFESVLGTLNPSVFNEMKNDKEAAKNKISAVQGAEGLMIFNLTDHGLISELAGFQRKAKLYEIGSPIGAAAVMKLDLKVALYIPLRVLVYESNVGNTHAAYDMPSKPFGQPGNQEVADFFLMLDEEIQKVIELADRSNIKVQW